MGDLLEIKINSRRRTHPPIYSYSHIRQKRNARRDKNNEVRPLKCCLDNCTDQPEGKVSENKQEPTEQEAQKQTDQQQTNKTLFDDNKLKLINSLPDHMLIPPGINVSVPPPPLNVFPPGLIRIPIRPAFPPAPPQQPPLQQAFNVFMMDPSFHHPLKCIGMPMNDLLNLKLYPHPPMNFPAPPRYPPSSSAFLEPTSPAYQREFSRVFAEHTIKAALGIPAGSALRHRY